eukprot:15399255-Alexandrium_andersonii.AAC.1
MTLCMVTAPGVPTAAQEEAAQGDVAVGEEGALLDGVAVVTCHRGAIVLSGPASRLWRLRRVG